MALAPNRSRAKRTTFSSYAGHLYPEDDPQASVTEQPDEDAGDEQDGAAGESPAQPMSQKDMADKVYPEKGQDDQTDQEEGESGQEDDEPDGADQEADGDSDEETSDDKAAPRVINGSKSESYDTYVKTGGSRSWRNNNPGNIEYHGQEDAVGLEKAGRFAKYATPEAGMNALKKLLGTVYKDMPVTSAMRKFAPLDKKDMNNPEAYVGFLGKHGVDLKKPVGQQIDKMAEAIKKQEGWIEGAVAVKK